MPLKGFLYAWLTVIIVAMALAIVLIPLIARWLEAHVWSADTLNYLLSGGVFFAAWKEG